MFADAVQNRLEQALRDHVFPGCVLGVVQRDGSHQILPFGRFTYELTSPLVAPDAVYDVASVTKAIPTAAIALKLIEEGKLALDERFFTYVPEYSSDAKDTLRIRHLLSYNMALQFPIPGFSIERATPEEIRHNFLTTNHTFPPGAKKHYSNSPSILLTMAIERITGKTIDVLADEYFFTPLHMTQSTFFPKDTTQIPPTEITNWRGCIQGEVHDETAYVLLKNGASGHAGLFSNAPDLLTFIEMLLRKGEYEGERFFSEAIVTEMHTNQLASIGESMGLGFELNEPRFMGDYATSATFGKTGFTGTVIIVDIPRGVGFALLSNRTFPTRPQNGDGINAVRRDISDIVFRAC